MRRRERSRDFDSRNSRDDDPSGESGEDSNSSDSGSEGYTVEQILDKKIENGRTFYLIKWEGYPSSENTWEPIQHLENVRDMIDRFERKYTKQQSQGPLRKDSKELHISTRQRKDLSRSSEREYDLTRKKRIIETSPKASEADDETERLKKAKSVFVRAVNMEEKKTEINSEFFSHVNGNGSTIDHPHEIQHQQTGESINGVEVDKEEGKEQEKTIRKHKTIKKKPKHGSLKCKDRPSKVMSIRPSKSGYIFLIEWEPRADGVVPEPSYVTSAEFKELRPQFLIDFYESKIVVFRKKAKLGEGEQAKENVEEKLDVENGTAGLPNESENITENKEVLADATINERENQILENQIDL